MSTEEIASARRAFLQASATLGLGGAAVSLGACAQVPAAEGRKTPTLQLIDLVEAGEAQKVGTGYKFAEGPLWHPAGYFFFTDPRDNKLHRYTPGKGAEFLRDTKNANGITFDMAGNLVACEGNSRMLTRWNYNRPGEQPALLLDRVDGKRITRPNDVACHSNGDLLFTDPTFNVPVKERDLDAAVWRLKPDGTVSLVAHFEYPNGLCFSPDERTLYVANTRWSKCIHEVTLDDAGKVSGRRIFHDMTADKSPGSPDGIRCDVDGRVYCTGPGGIWVMNPDGTRVGVIKAPQPAVSMAFGGADLKTLLITAHDSIYTVRMKVAGLPHPWYAKYKR